MEADVGRNAGNMVVEVPGEELDPEDCAGWMKVRTNGRSDGSAEARPNSHVARRVIERIERGAKMPRVLPREAIKVIMRPRGGLDLSRVSIVKVMCAIGKAARVEMEDMGKDTLCPNVQQNIVVVCTEDEQRVRRYANVEVLVVEGKSFETKAYVAAPYGTTKGVIRGVPLEHSAEDIDRNVVGPRNPTARATQRIGSSATVIVVFEGEVVPRQVYYGGGVLRCSLYRKHFEVCFVCGRVGHRSDVCPTPEMKRCMGCGVSGQQEHECTPRCKLCGGQHVTGDRVCRNRFRTPYIVRKRFWERKELDHKSRGGSLSGAGAVRGEDFPDLGGSRSVSTERGDSRSRSRSRGEERQVSWAQVVKSGDEEMEKLREDNRRQAGEIMELRKENKELMEKVEMLTGVIKQLAAKVEKIAAEGEPSHLGAPPAKRKSAGGGGGSDVSGMEKQIIDLNERVVRQEGGLRKVNEKLDEVARVVMGIESFLTQWKK
ncbi:uncharacterized protein LOC120838716 [Ixodes scapularis]|uniref:uncharacterized protein LOC120838716 n=1 Tax=Ixodes scapularis TaxID=6945 RepID=UPI001A9F2731|nr:uncharacterized protein LOC120838716 [Ixodes scapularis]